jgi:hypothetical protein
MDTIQSGGIGKPLAVFAGWMILGQGLLAGFGFAFPDIDLPGSFGLVITIVAVLLAGQSFAKASGRVPEQGEQVRFGLGATLIALALAAGSVLAIFAWYGVPVTVETLSLVLTGDVDFAREIGGWLWVILGVGVLITYLLAHFGLKSAAKGYLKKQAKLAARG